MAFHRELFISIFTNIEPVKDLCSQVVLLLSVGSLFDCWQCFLQGPIRALGIQGEVISYNLVAYWTINLPLSYFFAFTLGYGLIGLWMGMLAAQVFLAVIFTFIIETTNW